MRLPVELVTYIIKNSYTFIDPYPFGDGLWPVEGEEGEESNASSIALTSHAFRDILNKTRFRNISFSIGDANSVHPDQSDKLGNLVRIIKSGKSVPSLPPLYSYIAKFHLEVIGIEDEIFDVMEDGSIAYILDNLFRPSSLRTSSSSRTLGLHLYIWRNSSDTDIRPTQRHWRSINPKLLQSIKNVLKFSDVNELTASHIDYIPRELLQRSNLKSLWLDAVSISWAKTNRNGSREPLRIESLTFNDDQITIEGINGLLITHLDSDISGPPTYILPCLVHLELKQACSPMVHVMNKILECAPALQSLVLRLFDSCPQYGYTEDLTHRGEVGIKYGHLNHLQHINISLSRTKVASSILIGLLEKNIPACVNDITIVLYYVPYPPKEMDLPTLDKHLADASFDSVDNIDISFKHVNPSHYDADKLLGFPHTQIPLLKSKRPGMKIKILS